MLKANELRKLGMYCIHRIMPKKQVRRNLEHILSKPK